MINQVIQIARSVKKNSFSKLRLFNKTYQLLKNAYYLPSFSQEGEDIVLTRLLGNYAKPGFYVDIGAHHPYRFSNTYNFYLKGWSGINIDPLPGNSNLFNECRPRDINLELGVSNNDLPIIYYMFDDPALNGFDKELSQIYNDLPNFHIKQTLELQTFKLSKILDQYFPAEVDFWFMNVDAEGLDLDVLISNDWVKYRPNIILVEDNKFNYTDCKGSEIYYFLRSKGYKLISHLINTSIFQISDPL